MRIGLLLVDNLDPQHAAVDGDYDALYRWMFDAPDVELESFPVHLGRLPAAPTLADAWVIGGSRRSVYDDDAWIHALRRFVRDAYDADATLVGICFGHQLVADVLGGRAGPSDGGWCVGATTYSRPDGSTFDLLASHRDQVLELPHGAEVTLTAERCPVAGFRIGDQVITVQGHPEFSGALAASIYAARRALLGDAATDAAIASCDRRLGRRQVADELLEFMRARMPRRPERRDADLVSGS